MPRCRDCALYDLDELEISRTAKCLWKSREKWPDSALNAGNEPIQTAYMLPNEGENCQCFIKRDAL